MGKKVYVPPLKIQGIKTKLVPLIKQSVVMQADSVWIEPFMGSGVVGFNVEPHQAIFSDTNPHIIEFYKQIKSGVITANVVRNFLEKEGKLLEQGDEKYYYIVRTRFNNDNNPLDFLFLNRACFNGMIRFNKNYAFNVPYGHKPQRFVKDYVTKIVHQVANVERILKTYLWKFLCKQFEITISMAGRNDFFIVILSHILYVMLIIMISWTNNQNFLCAMIYLKAEQSSCCQHWIIMIIEKINISKQYGGITKKLLKNIFIMSGREKRTESQ